MQYDLGCRMPLKTWVWLNRIGCFEHESLIQYVSPFPTADLMHVVSGLTNRIDFASHGADFYIALSEASPRALTDYKKILDFGCGCGRLLRMFKGHPHEIFGCDIDRRGIEWIKSSLPNVHAEVTSVSPPLPYPDNAFDAIISISIFSHLTEESQIAFLKELWRVSAQDAYLFLTVHGQQALERALSEKQTREMISVEEEPFQMAQDRFVNGEHGFILQDGHLTTTSKGSSSSSSLVAEPFEYGIAFIPEEYVRRRWSEWFTIVDYRHGAIYDFQDIIVLTPKKPGRKEEAIGNLSMEV